VKIRRSLVIAVVGATALVAGAVTVFAQGGGNTKPPMFAVLNGGNEVSDTGAANAGDQNGRGGATVIAMPGFGRVCFAVTVDNIDTPIAMHIHFGKPGVNGPIVVTLRHPRHGDPGASSGCVSELDRKLVRNIEANPQDYYVNVHTERFPAGAIRGQLF
jgi:hypothetical protein